jgi:peptide deformylase
MSKLEIVLCPDSLLTKPCELVTEFDQSLTELVDDMYETMDYYSGIGLAAPQIGLLKQLLVVDFNDRKFALVNPILTIKEGSSINDEGCLSLPNMLVTVERFSHIEVQAQDLKGNHITLDERGFIATIIQHEMDHLIGRLITDYGQPFFQE